MNLGHYFLLGLLFLYPVHHSARANTCQSFKCGILEYVGFPFSNINNPECGFAHLNCTGGKPKVQFHKDGKWYFVDYFNYFNQTIVIRDEEVQKHLNSNKCDLLSNFTDNDTPLLSLKIIFRHPFFKCKRPYPNSRLSPNSPPNFFKPFSNYTGCSDYDLYFYDNPARSLPFLPEQLSESCSVIHSSSRLGGFDLGWPKDKKTLFWGTDFIITWNVSKICMDCYFKGGICQLRTNNVLECPSLPKGDSNVGLKIKIGAGAGIGALILTIVFFLCWKCHSSIDYVTFWKHKDKSRNVVEEFLKSYGSLAPKRYNYHDIKKITSSFKEKIGEGGYGCVYKGKLLDSRLVAVKLLNKAKGDGQEFINEVASISRTSHVNVVSLLGFCFDGSKRALVYEFMVNGSLEKFIFDHNPIEMQFQLRWESLYKVAVGVARGLEYLHRGCNTRILHFDIKPHNILLDQHFVPKISDFGLAKLCLKNESIISMLDARGTAGYIAPEVFDRNVGEVSHKSDVYSYGKMVLEIVGKRKNIDVEVDHPSEIYFPHWIYKRLEIEEGLGLQGVMSPEEEELARKMILVGLWCIQTNPPNRPAMTKVVEMLEGGIELLQIPPQPNL